MEELFGWFLKNDKRYILFLQQDSRGHLTFMAVNREIPKYLDATLWSRGFPAILTSGTLKAGNGFARTRQMTGLEKETGVRECVAESPFCYKENCLLYIPEHLRPMKKGSREEAEQLAGQIRDLVCSTYGHTLVLFTSYTLMGNVHQLLRDQIRSRWCRYGETPRKRLHGLRRWRMQCCSQPAPAGKVWTFRGTWYRLSSS